MIQPTRDITILEQWIGKQETISDVIDLRPARLMQSIIGDATEFKLGDDLPPLWHWLYFLTAQPLDQLGRDGHPKLGGFLPPIDLPRRMWAGGRFKFKRPLRFGEEITKRSTITSVELKKGRSGPLCFVTVEHSFYAADTFCFSEEHDIVYREPSKADAPTPHPLPAPLGAMWETTVSPDPVMLFRYSALTFNGHRIHYDRQYCREVENYPNLVFHGPLTATLLIGAAQENNPGRKIDSFTFRAISPLFDTQPFQVKGKNVASQTNIWAQTPEGALAMQATATFK